MPRSLQDLFEEFAVYDAEGDDSTASVIDRADNALVVMPNNDNEDQFTFDLDAPVTYHADGCFSAIDRNGEECTFTAFIMRRVQFDDEGNVA